MFIVGLVLGLFLDLIKRFLDIKIKQYKEDQSFERRWLE